MFKRYSCGCIGFVLYGDDLARKRILCIKACDNDGRSPELDIHDRTESLRPKQSEKLSHREVADLMLDIGSLVDDGNRLRNLQNAFRGAGL